MVAPIQGLGISLGGSSGVDFIESVRRYAIALARLSGAPVDNTWELGAIVDQNAIIVPSMWWHKAYNSTADGTLSASTSSTGIAFTLTCTDTTNGVTLTFNVWLAKLVEAEKVVVVGRPRGPDHTPHLLVGEPGTLHTASWDPAAATADVKINEVVGGTANTLATWAVDVDVNLPYRYAFLVDYAAMSATLYVNGKNVLSAALSTAPSEVYAGFHVGVATAAAGSTYNRYVDAPIIVLYK